MKAVIGVLENHTTLVPQLLRGLRAIGVFGGEEEGGGVRSRPGAARTILLFHIISARPCKQTRMVGSILGVCGLIFDSARTNKGHHHHPRAPPYLRICRQRVCHVLRVERARQRLRPPL